MTLTGTGAQRWHLQVSLFTVEDDAWDGCGLRPLMRHRHVTAEVTICADLRIQLSSRAHLWSRNLNTHSINRSGVGPACNNLLFSFKATENLRISKEMNSHNKNTLQRAKVPSQVHMESVLYHTLF